jgi:hypothetical protein
MDVMLLKQLGDWRVDDLRTEAALCRSAREHRFVAMARRTAWASKQRRP